MFIFKPISPHLLIYSLQTSSVFSILHRISSLLLLLLLLIWVSYYFILLNITFFHYLFFNKFTYFTLFFIKYFLLKISAFHFLNGIKIIFWNFNLFRKPTLLDNINKLLFLFYLILV